LKLEKLTVLRNSKGRSNDDDDDDEIDSTQQWLERRKQRKPNSTRDRKGSPCFLTQWVTDSAGSPH